MKKNLAYSSCGILLSCVLAACIPWGSYDNPGDADSANYVGYPTVKSSAEISPVYPPDAGTLVGVTIIISRVDGATAYELALADSAAALDTSAATEFASNSMDIEGSALAASTTYYWKAREKEAGAVWSGVFSFTTSSTPVTTTSAPTFGPVGGMYIEDQAVTLSCSTPGAEIYYTTDGTAPTSRSTLYAGVPVTASISPAATIKAIAVAPRYAWSEMASATYYAPSLALVPVAGGTFNNGTSDVTVSGFYMGTYEITQALYSTVTGDNPSAFTGDTSRPVEMVTWYDSVEFCNKLSAKDGLEQVYTITARTPATGYPITSATVTADWTKGGYRLPTEAEWEWAARGGTGTHGYTYAGSNAIDGVAWYSSNSGSTSHPVGGKMVNELGLSDMSGNVWEWCWDWHGTYPSGNQTDPLGAAPGTNRIVRGGSWNDISTNCTISNRNKFDPIFKNLGVGFRVVRPSSAISSTSATPIFTPPGETYYSDQSVTLTCATANSKIYYTLDGTVPTTGSTLYSGAIAISGNGTVKTVKAIATATGYSASGIGTAVYTISTIQAATVVQGASHYYAFQEGNGSTAFDSSGTNNGTISGATWSTSGLIGNCLSFNNGVNSDYVTTEVNFSPTVFTLSMWAKNADSTKTAFGGTLASPWGGGSGYLFHAMADWAGSAGPGIVCYSYYNYYSNWFVFSGTEPVTLGDWNMYTYVYVSGGTSKVYVNGTPVASLLNTPIDPTHNTTFHFGRAFISEVTSNAQIWGGLIDELGIWDRELTQGEIAAIYNSGSGCTFP